MLIVFILKLGTRDQSLLLQFFLHFVVCSAMRPRKNFLCSLKPNSEQQSLTIVGNQITVNEDNLIEYK